MASLGLALTVVLAGICWIAVQQNSSTKIFADGCAAHALASCRPEISIHNGAPYIPDGLWISLGLLGLVFVITLALFQRRRKWY